MRQSTESAARPMNVGWHTRSVRAMQVWSRSVFASHGAGASVMKRIAAPRMGAHLDSLIAISPQFAAGMVSMHEAMASRMLDAMGADMTAMGMTPDPAWTALTDSIKRDLADLPTVSGRALDARLKAHIGRMRRLMAMHEGMMHGMKRPT